MIQFIKNIFKRFFYYEKPETYDSQDQPTIEDYIERRYKKQLEWYEKHARNSRIIFYSFQFLIILASSLIPVINVIPSNLTETEGMASVRLFSSMLGASVVVITGILQITKAQENWVSYRSAAELIKSEYQKFKLLVGDYSGENYPSESERIQLFVNRMETIFSEGGKRFLENRKDSKLMDKTQ